MLTVFYDSYSVLTKVYSQGAYITQALNSTPVEPLKRREITKICYGVLDKDIELSYYISKLSPKQPKLAIRVLLKIALYSIIYLSKPEHAVINSVVELVKKLGKSGASGYVNGVLRNFVRNKIELPTNEIELLSVKHSYPLFALKLLLNYYDKSLVEQIISYDLAHNFVRFNSGVNGEEYLIERGFEFNKTPFLNLFDVKGRLLEEDYENGVYTYQSIGSVAISQIVGKGEKLIDVCSAPGGKSVALSENFNEIISCDVHEHRVELIKSYAQRMKKSNINAVLADATIFKSEFKNFFDKVLADVPCSGFGTIKDNPDIKLNKKGENVDELCKIQLKILENVSKYLKVNGELIYSTCSIFDSENDCIIEKFLKNNNNFVVEKIDSPLNSLQKKYGLQFLPNLSYGAGFYVAKLKRIK